VAAPQEPAVRLRSLVDAEFDFVWRCLRRSGLSPADADDGAQRVFVVVARRLGDVEPGKERAFLFGTAQRVAGEMRRAASRRPETATDELEAVDPLPSPEEFTDRKRARALLDSVLASMPLEARTVFVLFELEELTVPEIARWVGVPEGTVASRLRRAREIFHAAAARYRAHAEFRGGH